MSEDIKIRGGLTLEDFMENGAKNMDIFNIMNALKSELGRAIDNTKAPKKPSDFKAYQNGFADCYNQITQCITDIANGDKKLII